ncbi:MAG: enoyl-CoA hydratase/isomerase family protein [Peptostreptococcaceae bacterium]|nr:enoyl-CoA hydratase/isomerase family protein [Peptostreptococcaceae bacterium]
MGQVNLKKENGICTLSINRPEALNALSREIVDEIDDYLEEIKNDDALRCLIIYSKDNFAAGADIKNMIDCDKKSAKEFSFSPIYNKIADLKIPTIAAIEGYALGGGLELALTADIRIADENSKMGFPEVTLGIFPGAGGTIRAPRIIGEAFAKELIFTGKIISAERAYEIGLVNLVASKNNVFEEAYKMATRISKNGPVAVRMAKDTIRQGLDEKDQNKAIDIEFEKWAELFETEDQKEGMTAFFEKRKPKYKNK